jgi:glycine betaine/proline transport system substrate-binding protein
MKKLFTTLAIAVMSLSSVVAYAADASCSTVRMADPGWSDIAATNATAGFLLDGMGYKTKVDTLAVPIAYGGLKDGQMDVFLGNWMPAQQGFYDKFIATGDVTQYAKNLEGTEFTLAVPDYVYDAGVHNFADLNKFADKFHKKIYGIGSGAPANASIQEIIKKNEFDLGDWKLVQRTGDAGRSAAQREEEGVRGVPGLDTAPDERADQRHALPEGWREILR